MGRSHRQKRRGFQGRKTPWTDATTIAAGFVAIVAVTLGITAWAARKNKSTSDHYVCRGGRRAPGLAEWPRRSRGHMSTPFLGVGAISP